MTGDPVGSRTSDTRLRLSSTEYEVRAREYAERVYRTVVALEPLYEAVDAAQWLASPQPLLNNGIPAKMLTTAGGTIQVEQLIARILDGAFS